MKTKPKVLIVQRIVPHYRIKFFEKLAACSRFDLTVAYGDAPRGGFLKSYTDAESFRNLYLGNVFLGSQGETVWQSGVASLLCSECFDVVIAEMNPRILSNVIMCLRLRIRGRPFIWWGHGLSNHSSFWSRLSDQIKRLLCVLSSATICYDEKRAERLVSLGIPLQKLFVAHNSIDTEFIGQLLHQYNHLPRTRILYTGRLIPEKKVSLLLEGFALAFPHLPAETKLTIIGDGPERAALESQAQSIGIASKVQFLGEITDESLLSQYFLSSLLSVSPGYIGLAAIHSMAYGVPVVVADSEPHSPEIAALKVGFNGLMFRSDDAVSLSKALCGLVNDTRRLNKMSKAALHTIKEKYSLKNMVRAFEDAVDYVLRVR